ncbi:MAG TPA: Crp/Fnr family transcriptional regulator [Acidobacteriota bacterium]|nr:Crp/Fnr family transcriptional regulator [Acidobacteriota bacterium]
MDIDIKFLRRVALFANLSDTELQEISKHFKERRYKRNDIIFFEEDTGHYMYIVKEGRVKVSRLLPSGKEMILAFHETGEYFGEMALIDGGTSPASVTAVVPTTIYVLSAQEFSNLLEDPNFSRAILKTLCGRCRDAWAQIEVLTFHNADARIRTALYQLSLKRGVDTDSGRMITMHLTHKELADITGVSRETATRILSHLQNEDLLTVETRHFIIRDPDRLVDDLLFD